MDWDRDPFAAIPGADPHPAGVKHLVAESQSESAQQPRGGMKTNQSRASLHGLKEDVYLLFSQEASSQHREIAGTKVRHPIDVEVHQLESVEPFAPQ